MERLSRSDIRKFFLNSIKESTLNEATIEVAGMKIGYDDSGIIVGNKKFSLTAITLFGEYPVSIKDIQQGDQGSLIIFGSTDVKDVEKPLLPEKLEQIKKEIESGKEEFVISGKLADVRFSKIT